MNKRRISGVTVFFEDGEVKNYTIPGVFSESHNSRKAGGFKNEQEWDEYFISFVKYDEPDFTVGEVVEEIRKQDREALRGVAYCSQHGVEPHDCFSQHVAPTAFSGREPNYSKKELPAIFQTGKEQTMRMYNLTDFGLDEWIKGEENGNSSV